MQRFEKGLKNAHAKKNKNSYYGQQDAFEAFRAGLPYGMGGTFCARLRYGGYHQTTAAL